MQNMLITLIINIILTTICIIRIFHASQVRVDRSFMKTIGYRGAATQGLCTAWPIKMGVSKVSTPKSYLEYLLENLLKNLLENLLENLMGNLLVP